MILNSILYCYSLDLSIGRMLTFYYKEKDHAFAHPFLPLSFSTPNIVLPSFWLNQYCAYIILTTLILFTTGSSSVLLLYLFSYTIFLPLGVKNYTPLLFFCMVFHVPISSQTLQQLQYPFKMIFSFLLVVFPPSHPSFLFYFQTHFHSLLFYW